MTREFGLSSDTGANSHHIAYFDSTDEPIRNPGMGLIGYSYSDNMWVERGTPPRPFEPEAFERMVQLPHCDHLYVRFNWREVQKEPGKLDLPAPLRATLEAVEKHRKPWSFRVMQALPQAAYPYAVPEYLVDKLSWVEDLAPPRFNGGPRFMPVYDEVYLSHWRELLFLLAEQFDGHPLLEFVDISGYGKWGELHHYPRDSFEVPEHGAIIKRLVDDHLAAFANTPAVMQLHPSWTPEIAAWKDDAIHYALERGCWARRDSFYPEYTVWEYQVASALRRAGAALVYEPGAVGTATAGERKQPEAPAVSYDGLLRKLLDIGVAYIGLNFNPHHAILAHERHAETLDYVAGRVGYRLRPAIVWWHKPGATRRAQLTVGIINDGVAPPPGAVTVGAVFGNNLERTVVRPPGSFQPALMETVPIEAADDLAPGDAFTLSLAIDLKRKRFPVQWAVPTAAAGGDRWNLRIVVPS